MNQTPDPYEHLL